MRVRRQRLSGLTAFAAVALLVSGVSVALPSPAGAATSFGTVSPVAYHLDNPRGLAFGSDGHLYVAEAGHGGSDCPKGAKGPEGQPVCFGTSGSLTRLDKDVPVRLDHFASIAGPDGAGAEGLFGLSQYGGNWHVLIGLSSHETIPGLTPTDTAVSNRELGRLIVLRSGKRTVVADVGGHDWTWANNHKSYVPGQFPDANPFFVTHLDGRTLVIDAGANTLDLISSSTAKVETFFPNPAVGDAVPTCLAKGPDGAYYVGELTAAGNKAGAARVWRVRLGQKPTIWHSGFSNITGCGFDPNGNFYAVELQTHAFNPSPSGDPHGAVIQVRPNGKRVTLGADKLFYPQGFAYHNHSIFVSNWSILPAEASGPGMPTGQVVGIHL